MARRDGCDLKWDGDARAGTRGSGPWRPGRGTRTRDAGTRGRGTRRRRTQGRGTRSRPTQGRGTRRHRTQGRGTRGLGDAWRLGNVMNKPYFWVEFVKYDYKDREENTVTYQESPP